MASVCAGNQADHCCYVPGQPGGVCPHLRDDGPEAGRRWVCTLRERMGSWEAVMASPEYQAVPGAMWEEMGVESCASYPSRSGCRTCGQEPEPVTVRRADH